MFECHKYGFFFYKITIKDMERKCENESEKEWYF